MEASECRARRRSPPRPNATEGTAVSSERRYRFGPLEQRALVGPLRPGQVVILAIGGAVGLGALYGVRSFAGLAIGVGAICAATAAIFVPLEGRTAEEWAPVAVGWALRRRRAKVGYRSTSVTTGTRIGAADEPIYEPSLPPSLADLELLSVPYGREEVGVMRDRRAGTYTAVLAVRAGAFGLRDAAEQERKLDRFVELGKCNLLEELECLIQLIRASFDLLGCCPVLLAVSGQFHLRSADDDPKGISYVWVCAATPGANALAGGTAECHPERSEGSRDHLLGRW